MVTKKNRPDKDETREAPTGTAGKGTPAAQERPPESAEDFEHTLRRLIAAKNRR